MVNAYGLYNVLRMTHKVEIIRICWVLSIRFDWKDSEEPLDQSVQTEQHS